MSQAKLRGTTVPVRVQYDQDVLIFWKGPDGKILEERRTWDQRVGVANPPRDTLKEHT